MKLESILLQVSLDCPRCHQPLHVQGLTRRAWCGSCTSTSELSDEVWGDWFGPGRITEALRSDEGEVRQITQMGAHAARYEYGRVPPRCGACEAAVPLDAVEAHAAAGGYPCGCGARVAVREADDLARLLVPGARWVVGEGPLGADTEPQGAAEPVLFQCMGCGGGLEVDGRERNVRCTFCGSANYLPDALWLRLHPPRVVRPFFVLASVHADGRPSPELLARLATSDDADDRRKAARDPSTPTEALRALARDPDCDVREALASNPACPVDLLETLAADRDRDVRARVARHPEAPVELLARLLDDRDDRVREAAVKQERLPSDRLADIARKERDREVLKALGRREDLPEEVLRALAGSGSDDARRHAARHRRAPHDVLLKLATDRTRDVVDAVEKRKDLPADVAAAMLGAAIERRERGRAERLLKRADLPADVVRAASESTIGGSVSEVAVAHPAYVAEKSGQLRRRLVAAAVGLALVTCLGLISGGGVAALAALRRLVRMLS